MRKDIKTCTIRYSTIRYEYGTALHDMILHDKMRYDVCSTILNGQNPHALKTNNEFSFCLYVKINWIQFHLTSIL